MPDVLVVPPFRTPLLTANGVPLSALDAANGDKPAGGPPGNRTTIETTRDWWLYWRTLAELANAGLSMITYGTHGDRPDAAGMPDGAIYVEYDYSGVIYQNQGGEWHYLAGTMYGTLSPDQRPVGLGVNDAGFPFRTTDTDPLLGAREFIWSGTAWVEATPVLYGIHADRPAGAAAPARCLYVETDRSEVLYQNQDTVWHFVAGTMWGTISPDQRPTDLGVNDAGFAFRGTDQQREFIWSGTAWIEATPPTPETNSVQIAYASGAVTLTATMQTIPGTTITFARAGQYLVTGTFFFNLQSADSGVYLLGSIPGAAADALVLATVAAGQSLQVTASQQWVITAGAGTSVWLQASKTGGAGTSTVGAAHTSITALWVSP